MKEYGYEIVSFDEKADVYIINTCCVTAEGERKSRQTVRKASSLNPDAVIAVTGCASQRVPQEFKNLPNVRIIAGNAHKNELPEMITGAIDEIRISDMSHFDKYLEMPDILNEKTRAFVKVQDGCNNFCSYCIIPYVRGRECSRKPENVLKQCERLAEEGFSEIVLTGIHLSSYKSGDCDLGELTARVCDIDGIERVRLGSLEPNVITDKFLDKVMCKSEFCNQYHLSLQSGSDTVLKRMNRKYTAAGYAEAVEKIRRRFPDAAISTDIIVGFCGETDNEFAETLGFARKIGFAWVHIFPYSSREGTVASRMGDTLSKAEKAARASKLSEICVCEGRKYRERFIGSVKDVLCETDDGNTQLGLTREHIPVEFAGNGLSGTTVNIKITGVTENGLRGERI